MQIQTGMCRQEASSCTRGRDSGAGLLIIVGYAQTTRWCHAGDYVGVHRLISCILIHTSFSQFLFSTAKDEHLFELRAVNVLTPMLTVCITGTAG